MLGQLLDTSLHLQPCMKMIAVYDNELNVQRWLLGGCSAFAHRSTASTSACSRAMALDGAAATTAVNPLATSADAYAFRIRPCHSLPSL